MKALREHVDLVVVWLTVLCVSQFFPYFPSIQSANELTRVYLAESIIDGGRYSIDKSIRNHGYILDRSVRKGKNYSDKAPGVAAVAAMAYAVVKPDDLVDKVRWARLAGATLPLLLLLLLMRRRLWQAGVPMTDRLIVLTALGLGSHAASYGILAFGHMLAATLLFAAYHLLFPVRKRRLSFAWAMAVGFLGAFAVSVEYPAAVYLLLMGMYGLWKRVISFRAIVGLLVGGLIPLGLLMHYHAVSFGSPFKTGYSFIANTYFSSVHAQGFMGISYPKLGHFGMSAFSPSKGLFFFFPIWALACLSLVQIKRDSWHRAYQIVAWAMILFVCAMVFPGGGWTVSQRHWVVLLPFLALGLSRVIQSHRLRRWAIPLWLISMGNGAVSLLWPHFHDRCKHPLSEVGWPMLWSGYGLAPMELGLSTRALYSILLVMVVVCLGLILWHRRYRLMTRGGIAVQCAIALAYTIVFFSVPTLNITQQKRMQQGITKAYKSYPKHPKPKHPLPRR